MKNKLIKEFWQAEDYRDFLSALVDKKLSTKLASRSTLARKLKLSPSFVTKLLNKSAHLTAESAEVIASSLDFNEYETLAFLDKLTLAKTSSKKLKLVINKRLQQTFDDSFKEVAPAPSTLKQRPHIYMFWKLAAILSSEKKMTLSQLSKKLCISEPRTQYLVEQMKPYFKINFDKSNDKMIELDLGFDFAPLTPGSPALYELSMAVRRAAVSSLEKRYPIHLVDNGEHYVSTSMLLNLSKEQIKALSIRLAQLSSEIRLLQTKQTNAEDAKLVGVAVDFFDFSL